MKTHVPDSEFKGLEKLRLFLSRKELALSRRTSSSGEVIKFGWEKEK
ncbi:MAG TPA: hypothetical protein HA222_03495 [Candidatus Diapherotrites archaeon]|uniref:Uncharacterized protein n=1 Tax=Candidatus Iainarchaeum sp. TaxID=3101447 RepID=A0A7J4JV88_9ARCH|nr:hypothetical protein [Candidatus Diapherotrites archaeon]